MKKTAVRNVILIVYVYVVIFSGSDTTNIYAPACAGVLDIMFYIGVFSYFFLLWISYVISPFCFMPVHYY